MQSWTISISEQPLKVSMVIINNNNQLVMTSGMPVHNNVSIPKDNASHQLAPPDITGELHGITNILLSAVSTGNREQSSQNLGLLTSKAWFYLHFWLPSFCYLDIFLKFSAPHHFNDELMLGIMCASDCENLGLMKISDMKWKAFENIKL